MKKVKQSVKQETVANQLQKSKRVVKQRNSSTVKNRGVLRSKSGGPKGIRIPVCALKGRRPSPLDDGATCGTGLFPARLKYSRL